MGKIKFILGGRRVVLDFEELDEILGITKPGTEGDPWSTQSEHLMFWARSTYRRAPFNSRAGE